MEELIKKAKEVYNLNGVVFIFEDGNIFNNKEYAKLHAKERGIDFKEVNLDNPAKDEVKEEIKPKNNKK